MVGTKRIKVDYSTHLDSMVEFIKRYLTSCSTKYEIEEVKNGILEFCYNYPPEFLEEIHKRVKLKKKSSLICKSNKFILDKFVNTLTKKDAEGVFLLRDAFSALKKYQEKVKKGFGILINRKYLFDNEENYFLLVDVFYSSLLKSNTKKEFLKIYFSNFRKLLKKNKSLMEKSKEVYEYIESHRKKNTLLWIDIGFHFTFCLFGLCSVRLHSKNQLKQDFFLFSVYPWLKQFFKDNYFSEKKENVLNLENNAILQYKKSLTNKGSGCFVGFAIGDSLGFPVAGINKTDIKNFFKSKITDFQQNKKHPFFSHLEKGQYTDNTNLLILSAKNVIENKGYNIEKYQKSLILFLDSIKKDKYKERWLGPTALQAIKNLSKGADYKTSGSTKTESCSSTYRAIPLGIFYKNDLTNLKRFSEISSTITHNSVISKTGTVITALIISNLINSDLPKTAIKSAMKSVKITQHNRKLIKKIEEAILFSKTKSIIEARKHFGTGSLIYQTLPLAIYCFLKSTENFEKAVLMATNSYRNDTLAEKKKMQKLSWEQQLQEAEGGNTDGIAGLTGSFSGAYLGINKIPNKFLKVENFIYLRDLGKEIIEKGNP